MNINTKMEELLYNTTMTRRRYRELDLNAEARLLPSEVDQGWHFCPDWDGMLVHPDSPEAEGCTCKNSK